MEIGKKRMKSVYRMSILVTIVILVAGCDFVNLYDSDQAAFESLQEADSDFTKIHPFDFYIYHPEKSGAERICAELEQINFQVTVMEGADEGEWLCFASQSFLPSLDRLSGLQKLFEGLTAQYGGDYDGWETIVIPK
jgi:hypothetical protein